jgi:chitodextrinase
VRAVTEGERAPVPFAAVVAEGKVEQGHQEGEEDRGVEWEVGWEEGWEPQAQEERREWKRQELEDEKGDAQHQWECEKAPEVW